jgi:hypothetical protein
MKKFWKKIGQKIYEDKSERKWKMEWINVNDDLPENGKQVLTLLEGYFGSPDNILCQKRSYRVFQSTFHRYKGWETPFSPQGCWVKYWMDKPDDPVSQ